MALGYYGIDIIVAKHEKLVKIINNSVQERTL
jgi:hypothetical protein